GRGGGGRGGDRGGRVRPRGILGGVLIGGRPGGLLRRRCLLRVGVEDAHHQVGDLLRLRRGAQLGEELGTDQGARELGEQLQVLVVGAGGSRDPDDEIGRSVG